MTPAEALAELEANGSEQTRKTYRRHGILGPQFGVLHSALGTLVKKIKTDHALAKALWASGNYDARVLATMVADPAALDAKTAEAWAQGLDNYGIAAAFAKLVARSPSAKAFAERWAKSKDEILSAAGWNVLAVMASDGVGPGDDFFAGLLKTIEKEIHTRPNWTRYSMNSAVIAIGTRSPALRKAATEAAKRIGDIGIDHGDTDCKTPDAVSYIKKVWDRKKT